MINKDSCIVSDTQLNLSQPGTFLWIIDKILTDLLIHTPTRRHITYVTCLEVKFHKIKVVTILDTGFPVNFILSWIACKICMATDLDHAAVYGTAVMTSTNSIGAYSNLPLRFWKLVLTSPTVVLKNEGCDLLIGTQYLKEFYGIVKHQQGLIYLLVFRVPLAPIVVSITKGLQKRQNYLLKYPIYILSLYYCVT